MNDDDFDDATMIVYAIVGCVLAYGVVLMGWLIWHG